MSMTPLWVSGRNGVSNKIFAERELRKGRGTHVA